MPRSPHDATRFTATGPYVSNKPSVDAATNIDPQKVHTTNQTTTPLPSSRPSASAVQQGSRLNPITTSIPRNETPAQKLQRLRTAAQLARQTKESSMDRTIRIGRIWADRAHRITALSLIGLTVISGVVAAAGITDMLMHNRRRRNEWLAEQEVKTARDVAVAKRDLAVGTATEEQLLLLNRERAREEAEQARQDRPSIWKTTTGWLSTGLSKDEERGGKLGAARPVGHGNGMILNGRVNTAAEDGLSSTRVLATGDHSIWQAQRTINGSRRQAEDLEHEPKPTGGLLDQQAKYLSDATTSTITSWSNWISWR